MSILTKTLAVLLSVFSLVLVGLTVMFVGNANNYRQAYESQQSLNAVLQADLATKVETLETQVNKSAELDSTRLQQIQNLEAEKTRLTSDLRKSERLSQQYQAEASSWKGVMTGFEQSVHNLLASLNQTQKKLDQTREESIKDKKDLNQITADLYEKIVQIQSLEADRRRLLEQKTAMEQKEQQSGTAPKEVVPVTQPVNQPATPASPAVTVATNIQGQVTNISQNLITLSVGTADGVHKNMVFHITRGDRFLCDVIITNADINQCAGVLDLVQQQPQVGDTASTQL